VKLCTWSSSRSCI